MFLIAECHKPDIKWNDSAHRLDFNVVALVHLIAQKSPNQLL